MNRLSVEEMVSRIIDIEKNASRKIGRAHV